MGQPSEANSNTNTNNNTNSSTNTNSNNKTKIIAAISAAVVVIVVAVCITVVALSRNKEESSGLTYASEAVVVMDQEALDAAVAAAQKNAEDNMISLSYQNDAFSTDGKNFSCYIANAGDNLYDMFLTICTDAEMTDQVFLSGLVRPGSAFEKITLDRALDPGDHTMYVAVTQVDTDEDGAQVIKHQVIHTIEFHVME